MNHMIVDYKGHTISCIIDSMGYEYIFFTVKDSIELDSMKIKDTYYIYTDLNKIFHYSWSFEENIRRMENRTGSLFTTYGDTINFMDIKFYSDMINPEIYIKKNIENSSFIPMLDVEKLKLIFQLCPIRLKEDFIILFHCS